MADSQDVMNALFRKKSAAGKAYDTVGQSFAWHTPVARRPDWFAGQPSASRQLYDTVMNSFNWSQPMQRLNYSPALAYHRPPDQGYQADVPANSPTGPSASALSNLALFRLATGASPPSPERMGYSRRQILRRDDRMSDLARPLAHIPSVAGQPPLAPPATMPPRYSVPTREGIFGDLTYASPPTVTPSTFVPAEFDAATPIPPVYKPATPASPAYWEKVDPANAFGSRTGGTIPDLSVYTGPLPEPTRAERLAVEDRIRGAKPMTEAEAIGWRNVRAADELAAAARAAKPPAYARVEHTGDERNLSAYKDYGDLAALRVAEARRDKGMRLSPSERRLLETSYPFSSREETLTPTPGSYAARVAERKATVRERNLIRGDERAAAKTYRDAIRKGAPPVLALVAATKHLDKRAAARGGPAATPGPDDLGIGPPPEPPTEEAKLTALVTGGQPAVDALMNQYAVDSQAYTARQQINVQKQIEAKRTEFLTAQANAQEARDKGHNKEMETHAANAAKAQADLVDLKKQEIESEKQARTDRVEQQRKQNEREALTQSIQADMAMLATPGLGLLEQQQLRAGITAKTRRLSDIDNTGTPVPPTPANIRQPSSAVNQLETAAGVPGANMLPGLPYAEGEITDDYLNLFTEKLPPGATREQIEAFAASHRVPLARLKQYAAEQATPITDWFTGMNKPPRNLQFPSALWAPGGMTFADLGDLIGGPTRPDRIEHETRQGLIKKLAPLLQRK